MVTTIGEMSKYSPWWTEKSNINKDMLIERWNESKVKWYPRIFHLIEKDINSDVVFTIKGPRQVGKTTSIKLLIQKLLLNIEPMRIFYWACDLTDSHKELFDIINNYLNFIRKKFLKERVYILLDEVSRVPRWQDAIKNLFDSGKLRNSTVIITGSHSLDIRKGAEKLPGRRGSPVKGGPDKIFLPMKFSEYAETNSNQIKELLLDLNLLRFDRRQSMLMDLIMNPDNVPVEIEEIVQYSEELSMLLQNYSITGGIALTTNEFNKGNGISEDIYATYVTTTIADILGSGKREHYLKQILCKIFETVSTPVSWNSLKHGTSIQNPSTIEDYINVLENVFAVNSIYRLNKDKGEPHYPSNKKIYISDPFIFHTLRSWCLSSPDYYKNSIEFTSNNADFGKLLECIVCNHLIRLCYSFNPSYNFDYTGMLTYWLSKKPNREVDFAIKIQKKFLPIGLTCSEKIEKNDKDAMLDFIKTGDSFNRGVLIADGDFKQELRYVRIPSEIFLLLI